MSNVRSQHYWILEPETGLTHIARPLAWTDSSVVIDDMGLHATLCDREVGRRWRRQAMAASVTCLRCIAEEG